MTKLEDVIAELEELDLVKTDERLTKKMKSFREKNLDLLASAAELRKDYQTLYDQIKTWHTQRGRRSEIRVVQEVEWHKGMRLPMIGDEVGLFDLTRVKN